MNIKNRCYNNTKGINNKDKHPMDIMAIMDIADTKCDNVYLI